MSTPDHTTKAAPFRPSRLPPSTRYGRPREIPADFPELVADHRAVGRTDDDIALSLGLTVDTLLKRLQRFGIPYGRRWRDIEDERIENTLTKAQARAAS